MLSQVIDWYGSGRSHTVAGLLLFGRFARSKLNPVLPLELLWFPFAEQDLQLWRLEVPYLHDHQLFPLLIISLVIAPSVSPRTNKQQQHNEVVICIHGSPRNLPLPSAFSEKSPALHWAGEELLSLISTLPTSSLGCLAQSARPSGLAGLDEWCGAGLQAGPGQIQLTGQRLITAGPDSQGSATQGLPLLLLKPESIKSWGLIPVYRGASSTNEHTFRLRYLILGIPVETGGVHQPACAERGMTVFWHGSSPGFGKCAAALAHVTFTGGLIFLFRKALFLGSGWSHKCRHENKQKS